MAIPHLWDLLLAQMWEGVNCSPLDGKRSSSIAVHARAQSLTIPRVTFGPEKVTSNVTKETKFVTGSDFRSGSRFDFWGASDLEAV